ncbi:hypothetical protein ACIBCC_19240 [Streptomyces griseus]|uniref:hypothetical protein n=1 Tax=Streptomyces griseus TaxID=1911 RepID=UPI00378F53AD
MTIQETLNALGRWDIDLKPTIPRDVLDALAYFGHVAIIQGRLDPARYGDNLLDAARYVGVLRSNSFGDDARTKTPNDNVKIGGVGMAMWLGDEDNKGDVLENATTFASGSLFPDVIRGLLPTSGAITEGTLYPVAGKTYSGTHQWQSPRQAIQYVCQTMSTPLVPVSWRVNNDGTLDAGPESNLFVTDPRCVVIARGAGEDMALTAVPGSMDLVGDVEDYTTRVVLLAEGEGDSTATGSADINPGSNPYKDIHGNSLKLTRLVSESDTVTANAATRAQLALSQFIAPKQDLRLAIQDYDIHGEFSLGDYVHAYDPDKGLVDTTNEIIFRGQRLNPIKLQITEISWGVTAEYTVAYRAADGTWYDLTDHIETSEAGTYVTVGDFSRQLMNSGAEPVGSRPNADTTIPGIPTLVEPFSGATYLDSRGFTRARVILAWNAPNNVDGSTILDGDHYEIRYAVDTDMLYPATWAQLSQVRWMDLQSWAQPFAAPDGDWQIAYAPWGTSTHQLQDLSTGIGYDIQIRAVDKTGNRGAWSGTTTFVTTSDNIPPSTPAAPAVAGSRIALQVTHELGKSSGGTFNLEADLHHLEVHVDYEPYFTPSPSTLEAKVSATAGMIQAQIPVVTTVQVEETSARYVRVVAVDVAGNKSGPSDAATATALLIDDAHISDLTVSKVTAGTITASWVMGGEIKTADTGARARMSIDGYELYNAAGTRTFFADATTGDVSIVGQIKSGTTGRRLEINPTSSYLPEIRFYPNSGTEYGFINAVSSGSDVNLGMNGSQYDGGGGTQVTSRVYLTTNAARLEVVDASSQDSFGGFALAYPNNVDVGFKKNGVTGGRFFGDQNTARLYGGPGGNGGNIYLDGNQGFLAHDIGASTETRLALFGGYFNLTGKWRNYSAAAADDAIFTGSVVVGTSTSITLSYGPTMSSQMIPVATCVAGNFGTSTPTVWGISSSGATGFTVAWNNSQGMRVNFWCYRA